MEDPLGDLAVFFISNLILGTASSAAMGRQSNKEAPRPGFTCPVSNGRETKTRSPGWTDQPVQLTAFAQGITAAKAALYQILYFQTPVTSLNFHQDHATFFLTEYNPTHLIFWIPLVKPSRTEAGLRLIPWDRLGEKSPRLFNLCQRSGASNLYSLRDGGTLYVSDWSGVHYLEENLEIEVVMETPEVGPGDLLLLRVNTIHATQMTDDRRLSVSLRTCDPETPIDWHRVACNPTPVRMKGLADQNPLSFPVFQHTLENHFGTTLGDIVQALTGERD